VGLPLAARGAQYPRAGGRRGGRCAARRWRLVRQEALADLAPVVCRIAPWPVQSGRQMSRGQGQRIGPRRAQSDLPLRFGETRQVWTERKPDFPSSGQRAYQRTLSVHGTTCAGVPRVLAFAKAKMTFPSDSTPIHKWSHPVAIAWLATVMDRGRKPSTMSKRPSPRSPRTSLHS
jgi:hypothetical protein